MALSRAPPFTSGCPRAGAEATAAESTLPTPPHAAPPPQASGSPVGPGGCAGPGWTPAPSAALPAWGCRGGEGIRRTLALAGPSDLAMIGTKPLGAFYTSAPCSLQMQVLVRAHGGHI